MTGPESQHNLPPGPLLPEAKPDATVLQFPPIEVPGYLRKPAPLASVDFIVDADMPVRQFSQAIAKAGLYIINTTDGRLCVTHRPWEWRL